MSIQIINADCMTALAALPDESVDCILTDPPYGETSLEWDKWPTGWPERVRRVLKKSGSMWVFGSTRMFFDHVGEFAGWRLSHDVVWEKHNGSGLFNDRFRRVHELALHFYRSDAQWADVYKQPQFTNDARARVVRKKGRPAQWIGATGETVYRSEDGGPRLMRSVMFCRSEHGRALHPTQKPVSVVEPLLLYGTRSRQKALFPEIEIVQLHRDSFRLFAFHEFIGFPTLQEIFESFDCVPRHLNPDVCLKRPETGWAVRRHPRSDDRSRTI